MQIDIYVMFIRFTSMYVIQLTFGKQLVESIVAACGAMFSCANWCTLSLNYGFKGVSWEKYLKKIKSWMHVSRPLSLVLLGENCIKHFILAWFVEKSS